ASPGPPPHPVVGVAKHYGAVRVNRRTASLADIVKPVDGTASQPGRPELITEQHSPHGVANGKREWLCDTVPVRDAASVARLDPGAAADPVDVVHLPRSSRQRDDSGR